MWRWKFKKFVHSECMASGALSGQNISTPIFSNGFVEITLSLDFMCCSSKDALFSSDLNTHCTGYRIFLCVQAGREHPCPIGHFGIITFCTSMCWLISIVWIVTYSEHKIAYYFQFVIVYLQFCSSCWCIKGCCSHLGSRLHKEKSNMM
jgi:hypothetical protein